MATTREDIKKWLDRGKEWDASHMLVVCDGFSYEDYPVYVTMEADVNEAFRNYHGKKMQRVMEVYSFRRDLDEQLNERRAFHFD
jgi:hypothetical protein